MMYVDLAVNYGLHTLIELNLSSQARWLGQGRGALVGGRGAAQAGAAVGGGVERASSPAVPSKAKTEPADAWCQECTMLSQRDH